MEEEVRILRNSEGTSVIEICTAGLDRKGRDKIPAFEKEKYIASGAMNRYRSYAVVIDQAQL